MSADIGGDDAVGAAGADAGQVQVFDPAAQAGAPAAPGVQAVVVEVDEAQFLDNFFDKLQDMAHGASTDINDLRAKFKANDDTTTNFELNDRVCDLQAKMEGIASSCVVLHYTQFKRNQR